MSRTQDPLSVEYILLGLIHERPIYAYDLYKKISSDKDLNTVWKFNQSQIYAVLDKIERNKLIQAKITAGAAYPFRKVYSLTEEGEIRFQTWKVTPVEHANAVRSDFMAKLYFLNQEPEDVFKKALSGQIEKSQEWLAWFQKLQRETSPEETYLRMVYGYRIQSIEMIISWLNNCLLERKG